MNAIEKEFYTENKDLLASEAIGIHTVQFAGDWKDFLHFEYNKEYYRHPKQTKITQTTFEVYFVSLFNTAHQRKNDPDFFQKILKKGWKELLIKMNELELAPVSETRDWVMPILR